MKDRVSLVATKHSGSCCPCHRRQTLGEAQALASEIGDNRSMTSQGQLPD